MQTLILKIIAVLIVGVSCWASNPVDDGQKYFGYYAGAMEGVGDQDYIPELANFSNLIFIQSANLEQKLLECEQLNKKAIVALPWVFFDAKNRLLPNHAQVFEQTYEPIIKRHLSTIVAFYGLDEPYMNGFNQGLSVEEIYQAQESMGRYLKSRFPQIPIAVILTTDELRDDRPLFPSFDWFGFDCYNWKMRCSGKSVSWLFKHLSDRVQAMDRQDGGQRFLIAVPQAGHPAKNSGYEGVAGILSQIPQYRDLVKGNPKIKVVMPFIWQSFNNGHENWVGARELPDVKYEYLGFFHDFIRGNL